MTTEPIKKKRNRAKKNKRKAKKKYERPDTAVRNRKTNALRKKREKQVEFLNSRIPVIKIEQRLVRTIKKVIEMVENEDYRGDVRLAIMFDHLFTHIEPDKHKRMNRLRKIFRLRPTHKDKYWVVMIYEGAKDMKKRGRAIGAKFGVNLTENN